MFPVQHHHHHCHASYRAGTDRTGRTDQQHGNGNVHNTRSKSQPLVSPTTGFYPPTSCTNNNTSTATTTPSQETNDQVGFND